MKYFILDEFTYSEVAERLGIDNTPNAGIVHNLSCLVDYILNPLREKYGSPIVVNSGYRCHKLNKVVGGVKNSAHIDGRAADIRALNSCRRDNMQIGNILLAHINDWPIDQVIFEKCDATGCPSWIHVAFSRSPRRQVIYT